MSENSPPANFSLSKIHYSKGETLVDFRCKKTAQVLTKPLSEVFSTGLHRTLGTKDLVALSSHFYGHPQSRMLVFEKSSIKALVPLVFYILSYGAVFFMSSLMPHKLLSFSFFGIEWERPFSGLLAPFLFLISGSITENYGYSLSRLITWIMVPVAIFCAGTAAIGGLLEATEGSFSWVDTHDLVLVLFSKTLIINVSIYLFLDFLNAYWISRAKISKKIKKGGMRIYAIALVTSFLFISLNYTLLGWFTFGLELKTLAPIFLQALAYHYLFISFFAYPLAVFIKKAKVFSNVDCYDFKVNYNPFKLEL